MAAAGDLNCCLSYVGRQKTVNKMSLNIKINIKIKIKIN